MQFSSLEYRRELLKAGQRLGITPEADSPLGTGRHLAHPVVTEVAGRTGRTPAQVLRRWCLQHGVPVIPKSTHRDRIEENAQIFDFTLAEGDMAALDALDRTGGTAQALEHHWWS